MPSIPTARPAVFGAHQIISHTDDVYPGNNISLIKEVLKVSQGLQALELDNVFIDFDYNTSKRVSINVTFQKDLLSYFNHDKCLPKEARKLASDFACIVSLLFKTQAHNFSVEAIINSLGDYSINTQVMDMKSKVLDQFDGKGNVLLGSSLVGELPNSHIC